MGDVAKIYFQTQSHSNHEYLRSKQQPPIDKSAEAQHADREILDAKSDCQQTVACATSLQTIELMKGLERLPQV